MVAPVVHSPRPQRSRACDSSSATQNSPNLPLHNGTSTSSCSRPSCSLADSDDMIQCSSSSCQLWYHFSCTHFPNVFSLLSKKDIDKLLFQCCHCLHSTPSLDSPNSIEPIPSTSTSDGNSSSSSSASSSPPVNSSGKQSKSPAAKHILHPLRLLPTTASLVLSDSQLRHVSKYGIDGSGSTQIYSLSGGKISDITNALTVLYDSSLSARRDKVTDVFVLIGGNDLSSSTSLNGIDENLSKLVGSLNLVLPKAEQHFLPFLPRPDTPPDRISAANSILKRTCGRHFYDLPQISATSSFFKNDRVHLNDKGVSAVCNFISKTLNVQGSRNSSLLPPSRQSSTSLLTSEPTRISASVPSFASVVKSERPSSVPTHSPRQGITPIANVSSAEFPVKTALLPTPPLLPCPYIPSTSKSLMSSSSYSSPGLGPIISTHLNSSGHLTTHPFTSINFVHPPGTSFLPPDILYKNALNLVISGIQAQVPQIVSLLINGQSLRNI